MVKKAQSNIKVAEIKEEDKITDIEIGIFISLKGVDNYNRDSLVNIASLIDGDQTEQHSGINYSISGNFKYDKDDEYPYNVLFYIAMDKESEDFSQWCDEALFDLGLTIIKQEIDNLKDENKQKFIIDSAVYYGHSYLLPVKDRLHNTDQLLSS